MQTRVKCLIVDDSDDNLLVLSALLRQDDVEVLMARSGAEALELLLVHDFALAFLDVQMPEMDGFELAELMRGSERSRHVPIIFVTAGAHDEHRLFRGYDSGAVDFLYKPINARVLKNKADVFFELYRQKRQIAQELHERTETLRLNEMFVAVLGHDLRNPLNAILLSAELLQRSDVEMTKKAAARISSSGKRMHRLIEDILDLARTRLGTGIPLAREPVDLGALVRKVALEHQETYPGREVEIFQAGNLLGELDPGRFAQILSNLVGNSFQHGQSNEPVWIHLDGTADDTLHVSVVNAGSIPADILPYVFDPFRGSGSEQGRREGLGLGLYIVQQITHAHGGTVEVHSGSANRTRFDVKVPRR